MGDADPTAEFFDKLDDESRWVVRRGVPIFEPHERTVAGPGGKPVTLKVTAADLPEIARFSNDLEEKKRVVGTLTDVHTIRPRADGGGMEPVKGVTNYGYQRNYRVGTYGPDQKPCILADWFLYRETADEALRRPHRSVEYQHGQKTIRGTAVMMNAPFLDMGMVAMAAAGDKSPLHLYAFYAAMGPGNADAPKDNADPKADALADGGTGQDRPEGDVTPEEKKLFEKCLTYCRTTYGLDEGWPRAAQSQATPDQAKADDQPDQAKGPVTPMSTDKTVTTYEQQIGELKAKIAGIEVERDQERCQALLYSLEVEGFRLTADEKQRELKKLAKLPADERGDRVGELRLVYADRKPPAGKIALYEGHVEPGAVDADSGNPFAAPWYHEDAVAYMMEHPGMAYEKACDVVKAAKKTA